MEDGDGISENGEIKLGLDPLKIKSDGKTSDAERIFEQKLDADSETFRVINSEENPYRLSVSAKASGYIGESVNVNISSYSNYLQNEAVAGDIIDIDYADSFKIETLTISFTVSENAADYYIFRYFEDVNMLLPVETQYDGNRVYTEAAEDGTYCIVDMDKWIENTAETTEVQSTAAVYNAVYASSEVKSLESLEVYFLMYIRSSSVDSARSSVANASRAIIDYCNSTGRDVRLYFAAYTGATVVSNETGNSYADNASTDEEIQEMLSRTGSATGLLDTTNYSYSLTCALKKSLLEISGTNENSKKYCFVVDVNFEPTSASNVAVVDEMKSYGVDFSFICNDYNSNIANYESLSTDGTHIRWTPDFSEVITDKVLGAVVTYNVNTGLCNKIPYNEALITSEWKDIYEKFYSGKLSIDEIKKLGLPDTDDDGNPDCLEIFMKYISFDENGNIILPTYDELARDAMVNSRFGLKGLDELVSIMKKKGMNISDLRILPLISNPVVGDSDGDGIPDNEDEFATLTDSIEIDNNLINDSYIFLDDNEIEELVLANCLDSNVDVYNINYKFNNEKLSSGGVLKGSPVYEGNKLVTNRPEVEYTRYYDRKSYCEYTILNDRNSDYEITINSDEIENFSVEIYDITWGRKGKKVTFTEILSAKQKEYKFSLKEGKNYKISIKINNPFSEIMQKYTFSIKQNNWVYSPNGGVVKGKGHYTAIYLTDDAIKMICDRDGKGVIKASEWDEKKAAENFPSHVADDLVDAFYDNDANYLCLLGEENPVFTVSSKVSTVSTYSGLIALIYEIPVVGEVATGAGALSTFVASYPVTSEKFRKTVRGTLESISGDDKSISLHTDRGLLEIFNCYEWKYKFINKYSEYYSYWTSYDKTDLYSFAYNQ